MTPLTLTSSPAERQAPEAVYRREVEIVDHPHGVTYGHEALALCRLRRTASGSSAYGVPTGATEVPYVLVIETDEQARARRIELDARFGALGAERTPA